MPKIGVSACSTVPAIGTEICDRHLKSVAVGSQRD